MSMSHMLLKSGTPILQKKFMKSEFTDRRSEDKYTTAIRLAPGLIFR